MEWSSRPKKRDQSTNSVPGILCSLNLIYREFWTFGLEAVTSHQRGVIEYYWINQRSCMMNHSKFYIATTIVVLFSSVVFAQPVPMPTTGVKSPFAQKPRVLRQKKFSEDSNEMLKIAGTVAPIISESTVKIVSGSREIALGTIVTSEGHILTKAGNWRADAKVVIAGQEYVPQIIGFHQHTDLALLKIDAGELPAVAFAQVGELQKGSWLISIGPGRPIAMGVFAGQPKKLGGSMGVMLRAVDEDAIQRVMIKKVIPRSAADHADLWVNDVIRSIDGVEVTSIPQLKTLLGKQRPYDQIELVIVRGEKELTIPFELGESSQATTSRRLYFEHAIQHDSKLSRNQCGGPVVSLTG